MNNQERIQVNCCPCFFDWYIHLFNTRNNYALYVRTLGGFWRQQRFDDENDWYFISRSNEVFHVCFEHLRMYLSIYTKDCFLSLPESESFENDGQHHCYSLIKNNVFAIFSFRAL